MPGPPFYPPYAYGCVPETSLPWSLFNKTSNGWVVLTCIKVKILIKRRYEKFICLIQ